jgi:hypothetical protein
VSDCGEKLFDDFSLGPLPGEAGADVKRLYLTARRFFGQKYGAIQTTRQQNGGDWGIWGAQDLRIVVGVMLDPKFAGSNP